MELLSLLAVGLLLYLLIGAGLGFVAYWLATRQARHVTALDNRLDAALREIAQLSAELRVLQRPTAASAAVAPAAGAAESEPKQGTASTSPAASVQPQAAMPWSLTAQVPRAAQLPPAAEAQPRETIEQRFTARWMLWIGAVAIALGGTFLVKYAIDQGWLGPTVRVALGFLFGCVLIGCGEWLRERPVHRAVAAIRPDYVPPALTAGGISIAFSSAYAGFALYNLLSPLAAFLVLGVLSAGAVLLALLQGPLVALLGILGGFATPLLVPSQTPSAWGLFLYLLFICAAAFGVVRFTAAWWLAFTTLAGAVCWPLLWFAASWQAGDAAALGCYLLALAAMATLLPGPAVLARQPVSDYPHFNAPDAFVSVAAASIGILAFVLLRMDAYGAASLVTLAALACLSCLFAYRAARFDALPALAEVLTLAVYAAWHFPVLLSENWMSLRPVPPQTAAMPHAYALVPIVPPGTGEFLAVGVGFAGFFAVAGYLALWRQRCVPWAVVSASTPVLLLTIAYWRIEAFGVAFSWALVALALAGVAVAAAAPLERHRHEPGFAIALAAYAAAATAALGLGVTMTLQQAWLTVALSVEVAALAWIALRLDLQMLRPVALVLTAVVLIRLTLNYNVIDYPSGGVPALNWVLYGYGLPAAAFLLAARWFRRAGDDALVMLLEAGALVFVTLLATLEIHSMLAGSLRVPRSGLLEPSLQSVAWLAIAVGLTLRGGWWARRVVVWGSRLLVGAALVQIVCVQVLLDNPLWSAMPVGHLPVLNLLLLAYGLPALLLLTWDRFAAAGRFAAWGCFVISLALIFLNVSLEVRHGFHGAVLTGKMSDAEWYWYSAAWLGLAGILLIAGIRTRSIGLRYGSLGVLVITVGKVFLSDMSDLTGLYRVASFFGLGLCLIGVGYLYQRFVFPAPTEGRLGNPT